MKIDFPAALPVTARVDELIELIRREPVLIVAGETGSGKSTQLPKIALAAGFGVRGKIACTQPRRVAALSVSRRVAEELGVQWGREVGCQIRFHDHTGSATRVKFMTDGVLLAEIQSDPLLRAYEVIIIDEAHERSLNIDFLLGYFQTIRPKRPDLRLIITSATLDTETFVKAFKCPVVSVEGRMYPVEVRYRPLDHHAEELGDVTFIEAAALALEEILTEPGGGDVLVFLPGERDIRELRDVLQGRNYGPLELLPLFGRLSAADQQRIFQPTVHRKVVLATNIAETSITIPGIRFVVDTGLVRMSRYSAQTRTLRLPVEPVAQSTAEQRKGRCGRVAEGICYRLYSEAELAERPRFTQPEIQRANLAAVALRMMAYQLGNIADFPFLNPPSDKAIRGAYALLRELGALDTHNQLTPLGQQLARLPIDPTAGRMLLEARREGSLKEVLVIASALSIQDPRERPNDQREAADAAHKRFVHPKSDFLTLLNLWKALHDDCERLSQRQMRKFCNAHFLNYQRMREWRDLHEQLSQALDELGLLAVNQADAEYHQIHRALLSGLLTNIAQCEQGNHYKGTHNRPVMLFPGSALFDKRANERAQKAHVASEPKNEKKAKTAEWVMAAEWVETSRLFARTVAEIDPLWVCSLGKHLTKSSYSEPNWDKASGRVMCRERILLSGLCLNIKRTDYGRVDAEAATEILIRAALVTGEVRDKLPFLEYNLNLRQKVEDWLARLRRASTWGFDDRIYAFYAERLQSKAGQGISSIHDLRRFIREEHGGNDSFLRLAEEVLTGDEVEGDTTAFPDAAEVNGERIPLAYAYQPGTENDGTTLKVALDQFSAVQGGVLDWVVPGHNAERVLCLLKALPKDHRVRLHPIQDTAQKLSVLLKPGPEPLAEALTRLIKQHYGFTIWPDDWNHDALPEYLRPRIQVVDANKRVLAEARDWDAVKAQVEQAVEKTLDDTKTIERSAPWKAATTRFEKSRLTHWSIGTPPSEIEIGMVRGLALKAYPGLRSEKDGVALRLFTTKEQAQAASYCGIYALARLELASELAWLHRQLERLLQTRMGQLWHWAKPQSLVQPACDSLLAHCLFRRIVGAEPLSRSVPAKAPTDKSTPSKKIANEGAILLAKASSTVLPNSITLPFNLPVRAEPANVAKEDTETKPTGKERDTKSEEPNADALKKAFFPLNQQWFTARLQLFRAELPTMAEAIMTRLHELLALRESLINAEDNAPFVRAELDLLLPPDILSREPLERLPSIMRYMRALEVRQQRYRHNPAKDAEKVARLEPLLLRFADVLKRGMPDAMPAQQVPVSQQAVSQKVTPAAKATDRPSRKLSSFAELAMIKTAVAPLKSVPVSDRKPKLGRKTDTPVTVGLAMLPVLAAYDYFNEMHPARMIGELGWMLEELKVSIFAQEIGTAFTVSETRFEEALTRLEELRP